jgi:hypothetical protein
MTLLLVVLIGDQALNPRTIYLEQLNKHNHGSIKKCKIELNANVGQENSWIKLMDICKNHYGSYYLSINHPYNTGPITTKEAFNVSVLNSNASKICIVSQDFSEIEKVATFRNTHWFNNSPEIIPYGKYGLAHASTTWFAVSEFFGVPKFVYDSRFIKTNNIYSDNYCDYSSDATISIIANSPEGSVYGHNCHSLLLNFYNINFSQRDRDVSMNDWCEQAGTICSCENIQNYSLTNVSSNDEECCYELNFEIPNTACAINIIRYSYFKDGQYHYNEMNVAPVNGTEYSTQFCLDADIDDAMLRIEFLVNKDDGVQSICIKNEPVKCACNCSELDNGNLVDNIELIMRESDEGDCCYDIFLANSNDCALRDIIISSSYSNQLFEDRGGSFTETGNWDADYSGDAAFTLKSGTQITKNSEMKIATICIDENNTGLGIMFGVATNCDEDPKVFGFNIGCKEQSACCEKISVIFVPLDNHEDYCCWKPEYIYEDIDCEVAASVHCYIYDDELGKDVLVPIVDNIYSTPILGQ